MLKKIKTKKNTKILTGYLSNIIALPTWYILKQTIKTKIKIAFPHINTAILLPLNYLITKI